MEDILYTVKEVSELIKTNPNYVYELIRKGFLPALELGSLKIRRVSLLKFLEKYEGKNLKDLDHIQDLNFYKEENTNEEVERIS